MTSFGAGNATLSVFFRMKSSIRLQVCRMREASRNGIWMEAIVIKNTFPFPVSARHWQRKLRKYQRMLLSTEERGITGWNTRMVINQLHRKAKGMVGGARALAGP